MAFKLTIAAALLGSTLLAATSATFAQEVAENTGTSAPTDGQSLLENPSPSQSSLEENSPAQAAAPSTAAPAKAAAAPVAASKSSTGDEAFSDEAAKRRAEFEAKQNQNARRHRPAVVFTPAERKARNERAKKKNGLVHEFLQPSPGFVSFFKPWSLKVGKITFLQHSVADLMKAYSGCRIIPSESKFTKDIVSCSNPSQFGADGDEVIFEYLKSNDALCGVEYYFNDDYKARGYARLIIREIAQKNSTYSDAFGNMVDSPLFRVSVQRGLQGTLVRITLNMRDEVEEYETFGREKVLTLDFGDLVVGKSKAADIKYTQGLPDEPCVRTTKPHETQAEYYGTCFGFPYESHYQVVRDPVTDIVTAMALTPLSPVTSALVDRALIEKYGEPDYCEKLGSSFKLSHTNHQRSWHGIRGRYDLAKNRPGTVFVGSCQAPILFTVGDRYIFYVDKLNPTAIAQDYMKRRADNDLVMENRQELKKRQNKLENFF